MNSVPEKITSEQKDTELLSLINAVACKDEEALTQLYELTVNRVYSLAHAMLSNNADAEEVVCDVFSQLWYRASDYQQTRGSVITWLLIICRSRALDLLRRKKPEYSAGDDIFQYADSQQQESASPDNMINVFSARHSYL